MKKGKNTLRQYLLITFVSTIDKKIINVFYDLRQQQQTGTMLKRNSCEKYSKYKVCYKGVDNKRFTYVGQRSLGPSPKKKRLCLDVEVVERDWKILL